MSGPSGYREGLGNGIEVDPRAKRKPLQSQGADESCPKCILLFFKTSLFLSQSHQFAGLSEQLCTQKAGYFCAKLSQGTWSHSRCKGSSSVHFCSGFFPSATMLMLQLYFPIKAPKLEFFNVKSPQKSTCLGDMLLQAKSCERGSPSQGRLSWAGEKDGRKVRVRRESWRRKERIEIREGR